MRLVFPPGKSLPQGLPYFHTSLPSRIIAHLETLPVQWCELLFYQFRQSLQNMLWVNWLEWLVGIVTNHSSSLVLILFSVVANRTNRTNRTASPIGFCFVVRLDSIGVYFAKFAKFASLAQWFLLCGKIGAIQLSKSKQLIPTYYKRNLWMIYFGSVMASSHDLTNASIFMPM